MVRWFYQRRYNAARGSVNRAENDWAYRMYETPRFSVRRVEASLRRARHARGRMEKWGSNLGLSKETIGNDYIAEVKKAFKSHPATENVFS